MFAYLFDFAVLAFAQGDGQPDIRPLFLVQLGLDRAILHPVHLQAVLERFKRLGCDLAVGPYPVTAHPAGCRQFQQAGKSAVIGQQQQAFGIDVQSANRDDARHVLRHLIENRRTVLFITMRHDKTRWFVVPPQPRRFTFRQWLAVNLHRISG